VLPFAIATLPPKAVVHRLEGACALDVMCR